MDNCMASKLLLIYTSKDYSREKIGCKTGKLLEKSTPTADGNLTHTVTGRPLDRNDLEANTLLRPVGSTLPSLIEFGGKYNFVIFGRISLFELVFPTFNQALSGCFKPLIIR
ncbi:hypothetical protein M9H77_14236 [Catharanthus roseus]|uniref:Uncharacterized protein n=1 Tax=Catharanthus roseus TaxID=4058 RepID=A0ACC0BMR8_CATRO|nr:hypothetical protein M9H77_14236 [Catharanthus roseus]